MRSAVAGQRHQPGAGSLPDLRPGPVPRAGRHRRGGRHDHRPRHAACCTSSWSSARGRGRIELRGPALRLRSACHAAAGAHLARRRGAVPDRHGELGRADAHRRAVTAAPRWRATPSRCGSSSSPCCRAGAWPTPRRRWSDRIWAPAARRAERAVWLTGLSTWLPRPGDGGLRLGRRPGWSRSSPTTPAIAPGGRGVAAHHQLWLRLLRLGHGADPGVQRRRRHDDADLDQPGLLLDAADPAGLVAGRRPAGFGPRGVFWAVAIAESVLAVVTALVFRRGGWKKQTV